MGFVSEERVVGAERVNVEVDVKGEGLEEDREGATTVGGNIGR